MDTPHSCFALQHVYTGEHYLASRSTGVDAHGVCNLTLTVLAARQLEIKTAPTKNAMAYGIFEKSKGAGTKGIYFDGYGRGRRAVGGGEGEGEIKALSRSRLN